MCVRIFPIEIFDWFPLHVNFTHHEFIGRYSFALLTKTFFKISNDKKKNFNYVTTYNQFLFCYTEWSGGGNGEYRVRRQLSVSSDSKLLDESAREEARVVMRPKRPPRPKSEAFLGPHDHSSRRTKRFSAFGVRGFTKYDITNYIHRI